MPLRGHVPGPCVHVLTPLRALQEYEAYKRRFEDMFLDRVYKYYPKCRGHVDHIELSTPLTAAHFLNAPKGGSYGLEWTPAHFDQELHEDWFNPVRPGAATWRGGGALRQG